MSPFENAMKQLSHIAGYIDNPDVIQVLSVPQRIIEVNFPVRMDSGEMKMFSGYRVQYNNARGPYKGGIRFHPDTDLDEVKALSFWMALKTATVGIPLGGGKGGVTVDPKTLSEGELERLTRGFTRMIAPDIGSKIDVPAPDVYTNAQIMDWIVDEYAVTTGQKDLGVVTGKTLDNGGSVGRDTATARGGFFILEDLIAKENLEKDNLRIAIQGIGNAGSEMAKFCSRIGLKVVAISDSRGGVYDENGLDIDAVLSHKKETGSLQEFDAKHISNDELLTLDVDVLIPAALENQIHESNADDIKAKYILELANGPLTHEADEILQKKGIMVIPDILANAGGVTVSYFEWKQNVENEKWTAQEVDTQLKEIMLTAWEELLAVQNELDVTLRQAAFVRAVRLIAEKIDLG